MKPKTAEKKAPPASKALTVVDRAHAVMRFDEQKKTLGELAGQSVRIVEVKDSASAAECHAARMLLKNTRIAIKDKGKSARDDAVKYQKAVVAAEKELIEIIEPEEQRLEALERGYEAEREKERLAKIEAEQERIKQIERDRLAAEQAEIDRQKAELKRQQDEFAEKQRLADQQFQDARNKADAEALELKRKADAERAQADADAKAKRDAEEKRIADDRQKLIDEQAAAAKKKLADELANATLRDAAKLALDLLVKLGQGAAYATIMLDAALKNDRAKKPTTKKRK